MDEADRNFRAGLGWVVYSRTKFASRIGSSDSGKTPDLPPGLMWAKSWLDAPRDIEHEIEMWLQEQSINQGQRGSDGAYEALDLHLDPFEGPVPMTHDQQWNEQSHRRMWEGGSDNSQKKC